MQKNNVILCVDDDVDDRYLLSNAIGHAAPEIEIVEAGNGLEALSYLEVSKSKGQLPRLIILDVNMPYMDGKETLKSLRNDKGYEDLNVVVFTSSANPNDQAFFKQFGVDVVVKPFNARELSAIVANFIAVTLL